MITLFPPADFTTHAHNPTQSLALSTVDILTQRLLGIKMNEIKEGVVMVSFIPQRGITKNAKACAIPAEIVVDKKLTTVVGLYLGDGDKGDQLKFSNCNLELIEYFLRYLLELCVRKHDLRQEYL